ncbi:adenylate kinase [bacterium]|nr:adenylate kinase [bacterium]
MVKKINVIGTSGSGKSTFSIKLAEALGYPYIEMDKLFWEPNWKWSTDEKFFDQLKTALNRDTWVLDGNYSRSVPIKWQNVEMIIWLDYSFGRTLFQAVKRAVRRTLTQEELWEGTNNRESFKKSFFSKDSIIWWTITTHKQNKIKYENVMSDARFAHLKFVRLKSHKEAAQFIENLKKTVTQS